MWLGREASQWVALSMLTEYGRTGSMSRINSRTKSYWRRSGTCQGSHGAVKGLLVGI